MNKTDGLGWLQGGWGLLQTAAGKCHWILLLLSGEEGLDAGLDDWLW